VNFGVAIHLSSRTVQNLRQGASPARASKPAG
jgi:hypothetical protein